MKNITFARLVLVLLASFAFAFAGCESGTTPAEDTGDAMEDAADEVEDTAN